MDFRRYYVPDALVFITQVVHQREPIFADKAHLDLLRETLRTVQTLHPFKMIGYVFLPDHFHLLIRPTGPSNFSKIMLSLKPNFTKAYKDAIHFEGRMRFWQKRFWDHVIRDADDLAKHLDYIHYNPVKHGLVTTPELWPHSSFLAWQARGVYPIGWGGRSRSR
jgi:putative transposase